MQPTKSIENGHGTRRTWQRPTVTKLAIRTETKTARKGAAGLPPQPPEPAAPESKLGFSFEMSLPLSARTGE
jgi:hypothetical protein